MQKKIVVKKYLVVTTVLAMLAPQMLVLAGPTLNVEFSASPASGTAPLENVDLTAVVSGTATGPITYKFDCSNDGSWDKTVTTNDTSYTAVGLCDYQSFGNYNAKVSVGRSGLFFEGTTAIMVNRSQEEEKEEENTEGNLRVSKTVKNITHGETDWKDETAASPEDVLTFRLRVTVSGTAMDNVVVKDILPGQTTFVGNLEVNGISSDGNIEQGINLGRINAGEEKTITFKVRVKSAESFRFGTTTLFNTASARADDGTIATSIARITVTRTGVLGAATSVSTGITEYLYGTLAALLVLSGLLYLIWQGMLRSRSSFAGAIARKIYLWRSFVIK